MSATWYCSFCKNDIPESHQKCPNCSKSIRCLFCNAVQRLQRTAVTCEKCKKSLLEAPRVPVPIATSSTAICTPEAVATSEEVLARARRSLGADASKLFVDADFPRPSASSGVGWKSFHDMPEIALFGAEGLPAPQDTIQGELGDCWLISVMALLAHHKPTLLYDLFVSKERSVDGIYAVRLWVEGSWVTVVVDSYLPVNKGLLGRDGFTYAHSQRGTTCWAALLEKAVAKVTGGGYESLTSGQATEAFLLFTGLPTLHHDRDDRTVEWSENFLSATIVRDVVGAGNLVAVTCTGGVDIGLSKDHVYSVLDLNNDHGELLLQLRNPWGVSRYTGVVGPKNAFTERAAKMEDYRKQNELMRAVTAALSPAAAIGQMVEDRVQKEVRAVGERAVVSRAPSAPDGVFWIPFGLFVAHFSDLYICRPSPGSVIFTEPHVVPRVPRQMPTNDELKRMVISVQSQTKVTVFCSQRSARVKGTVYADMMVCVCPIADPNKKPKSSGGLFSKAPTDFTEITGTPFLGASRIQQTVVEEFDLKAGHYVVFPVSLQCMQKVGNATSSSIHLSVYAPSKTIVAHVPESGAPFLHLVPAHVICRGVKENPAVLAQALKDVTLYTLWRANACLTIAVFEKSLFGGDKGTAKVTVDFKDTTGMVFLPRGRKSCCDVPYGAVAVVSFACVEAHTGKYTLKVDRDVEVAFSDVATKVLPSSENDLLAPVKIKQCLP